MPAASSDTASGQGSVGSGQVWPTPVQTLSTAQSRERERSVKRGSTRVILRSNSPNADAAASGQGERSEFNYDEHASWEYDYLFENYFVRYDSRYMALKDEEVRRGTAPGSKMRCDVGVLEAVQKRCLVAASGQGALGPNFDYRRDDKKLFNETRPMTLMLPEPMIWVGGIDAARNWKIHSDCRIKLVWTVANICTGKRNKKVRYMNPIDMNAVTEGEIDFDAFLDALIEFDEQAEVMGSALVHCLQGANRLNVYSRGLIFNVLVFLIHVKSIWSNIKVPLGRGDGGGGPP